MPAQSLWEVVVAILIPVLVMGTALLMERVERRTIGTANERDHDGADGSLSAPVTSRD
jgi:hypothetical protein